MIGGTIQEEASEDIIWRKCFSSPRSLVNVVKSFSLSSAVAGVLLLLDGTMSHCCSSSLFRNPSRRGSAKKLVCRMCCKSNDNKPIVCVWIRYQSLVPLYRPTAAFNAVEVQSILWNFWELSSRQLPIKQRKIKVGCILTGWGKVWHRSSLNCQHNGILSSGWKNKKRKFLKNIKMIPE